MHADPRSITPSGTEPFAPFAFSSAASPGSFATPSATQARASAGIGTTGANTVSRSRASAADTDSAGADVLVDDGEPPVGLAPPPAPAPDATRSAAVVVERAPPARPPPSEHPNNKTPHAATRPIRRRSTELPPPDDPLSTGRSASQPHEVAERALIAPAALGVLLRASSSPPRTLSWP